MKKIVLILLLMTGAYSTKMVADENPVYRISLIHKGTLVASANAGEDLSFCFFLKKDTEYYIEINGRARRRVKITTQFKGNAPQLSFFKFYFKELTAEPAGEQCSAVFNDECGCFYLVPKS